MMQIKPHLGQKYIIKKNKKDIFYKALSKSQFYNTTKQIVYPFYKIIICPIKIK